MSRNSGMVQLTATIKKVVLVNSLKLQNNFLLRSTSLAFRIKPLS